MKGKGEKGKGKGKGTGNKQQKRMVGGWYDPDERSQPSGSYSEAGRAEQDAVRGQQNAAGG